MSGFMQVALKRKHNMTISGHVCNHLWGEYDWHSEPSATALSTISSRVLDPTTGEDAEKKKVALDGRCLKRKRECRSHGARASGERGLACRFALIRGEVCG